MTPQFDGKQTRDNLFTLLIVDDEPNVLSAFRRHIKPHPIELFTANSAKEAFEVLDKKTVHVLLTDYRMHSITGLELCKTAKERWPEMIRMLMTGQIDLPKAQAQVAPDLICNFIVKPWDEREIIVELENAFEEWCIKDHLLKLHKQSEQFMEEERDLRQRILDIGNQRSQRVLLSKRIVEQKHRQLKFTTNLMSALCGGIVKKDFIEMLRRETETLLKCTWFDISKAESKLLETRLEKSLIPFPFELKPGVVSFIEKEKGEVFNEKETSIFEEIVPYIELAFEYLRLLGNRTLDIDQWEASFNAIRDPVFITDEEGKVLKINKAVERSVGIEKNRIISKKIELFRPHFLPQNGFHPKKFSIRSRKEAEIKILEIFKDCHSEHKLSQELLKAERPASVGRLSSRLASEILSPLEGTISILELLREEFSDEMGNDEFTNLEQELHYRMKMIHQIIDFSNPTPLNKPAQVDLNELVEQTLTYNIMAGNYTEIKIMKNLNDHLPIVIGDKHQLQQVCYNLIINACQAMGSRGTLTIESNYDEKGSVYLSISDTGKGITQSDFPKIFDPFFTTSSTEESSGIGLSTIQTIIREHRGKITVSSRVGVGSKFTISLPQAGGSA